MSPALVMILKIPRQHTAQVTLIEDDDVIQTFAAVEPMRRSTYGFCQGDRGAVTTSLMPIT
jgi:hypothetical protein